MDSRQIELMLPSWNASAVRDQIVEFVQAVTDPASPAYVTPLERIATFDNDGTLWAEYPVITQALFALDRFREIAASNPAVLTSDRMISLANGDLTALSGIGMDELEHIVYATHTGVSVEELNSVIDAWLAVAKHPRYDRPFPTCIYQPMVELLDLLKTAEFTSFIVTGGGIDFVRRFAMTAYGIPPHRVIGSYTRLDYTFDNGAVTLMKTPTLGSFNDRQEKVVNIALQVGQRPILAAGNSDGDLATFRYANTGPRKALNLLVHHDDAEREAAYDRDFALSPLREALEVADEEQIQVISMKSDWLTIFPG